MDKDPQFPKKEDEYKLAGEEQAGDEMGGEESAAKTSRLKRLLSNRRFLLFLVIIIAVFVVYLFLGNQNTVKEEVAQFEQPKLQAAPTMPMQAPVQPIAVTEAAEITTLQQQLSAVSQQTQQNQTQIQQLQNSIQQLQNTVSQLTNQVATMSSTIDTLAASMVKPTRTVSKAKKAPPRPVYQVRAVVPGRAWLQEKQGQHIVKLLTVKVGDFLPGYGRVQVINPSEGQVITSWGSVIRYAHDN
jgi:intracellular multiplication protein IcmG